MTNYPLLALFAMSVLPGAIAKGFGVSFLRIAKWYLYASVFAVVVVIAATFFPFIGGKYDFFRVATELALASFILWWAFEASEDALKPILEMWKKPLVVAVSLFVLAFLIATLFALDMHAAFWSNFERGEGGFQMIHYYILFVLAVALFRDAEDWRNMFRLSLVAAVLMILYGIMSAALPAAPLALPWPLNIFFIGPYLINSLPSAPTFWGRLFSDVRFQGSLGNPAYVAPYLMFSMFYALWLWLSKKSTAQRTVACLGFVVFSLVFFGLSETRGAGVGLFVAIYLFLIYVAFKEHRYRNIILGTLAALVALFTMLVHFRANLFIQSFPGGRLFDLPLSDSLLFGLGIVVYLFAVLVIFASKNKALWWAVIALMALCLVGGVVAKSTGHFPSFADSTTSTRFWTCGSAWQGFLDSPKTFFFGWGPENFTAAFDKYFNPKHFVPGAQSETWFDRAHSVVFDYLAETGILGFLAYAGMFVVFYWEVARRMWRKERGGHGESRSHVFLQALLFVVPIGYLVQGFALFDVLPIYINVFIFLAFASYLFYRAPHEIGFPKLADTI